MHAYPTEGTSLGLIPGLIPGPRLNAWFIQYYVFIHTTRSILDDFKVERALIGGKIYIYCPHTSISLYTPHVPIPQ